MTGPLIVAGSKPKRQRVAVAADAPAALVKRSPIVTGARKPRVSVFGPGSDMTPEEHKRRGDAADALFRQVTEKAR